MLSKENILNLLLVQDKLWQSETKHEAMRLLKSLYENSPEHRERLVDYVLIGPPLSRGKDSEDDKRYTEHSIFIILRYLQDQDLELTYRGEKYLEKINVKHPKWNLDRDTDIENPVYAGWHENQFTSDEIHSKLPKEIALKLRDYQGTRERNRSDFCETVGTTCHMHPKWGLELFRHLNDILTEFSEETINHIIWGFRSTDEKEKITWNLKQIHHLTNIFQKMVEKRPVAKFWTSLPSLLQSWQQTYKAELDFLYSLRDKLANIFKPFDYEREEQEKPVEWLQNAINHPYGELTGLCLKDAHQRVVEQEKTGIDYTIDHELINFFEFTIDHYDNGARYGLCVLGKWLNWLEAVVPDWTEQKLIPAFNWINNEEMALVVWSGYLWNTNLSRYLMKQYNDYFLGAARHYNDFGEVEREGLTNQVAALIWFKEIELSDLKKFAALIDREGRIHILEMLREYLVRAEKPTAGGFWNRIIIPYWDWCERQRYLSLPDGNTERFKFWELIPYSHELFTKAVKRATTLASVKCDDVHLFIEELLKTDYSILYPDEFVSLLLAFIEMDQNPRWHKEEWEQLWNSVEKSGAKKLGRLKDQFAKKAVTVN